MIDDSPNYKRFKSFNEFYDYSLLHFHQSFANPSPSTQFENSQIVLQSTIGRGSFGVVVVGVRNGQTCAVKIFYKRNLIDEKLVGRTIYEKSILSSLSHPNVIDFLGSYKDNGHLYIVMKFINTGDLYEHLKKRQRFIEDESRLIGSQIILAFDYLHGINVVHRDIKAENILVEENGYVKLTDFGFAKYLRNKAVTLCGTPDYMAPEVVERTGYTTSGDLWALGVLMYELNAGFTPFAASDSIEIMIKAARGVFQVPEHFSYELKDLVKGLLIVKPKKRLGCGYGGLDSIKTHNFFKEVDWWALFRQDLQMIYRPSEYSSGDRINSTEPVIVLNNQKIDSYASDFESF
ncbi:hypothetical protein ACOME3_004052 [Neoechinorhynchus agilis]